MIFYRKKLILCTGVLNANSVLNHFLKIYFNDIQWVHKENSHILYICFKDKSIAEDFVTLKIKDFKLEYAPEFVVSRWEALHTKYDRNVKPSVYLYVKCNIPVSYESWFEIFTNVLDIFRTRDKDKIILECYTIEQASQIINLFDDKCLHILDKFNVSQHLYFNISFIDYNNMKTKVIYKRYGSYNISNNIFNSIEEQKKIVTKVIDFLEI